MRLPRDVSGADVIRALERAGFLILRQSGSHVRLGKDAFRVTVPRHPAIAPGTLKSIFSQAHITVEELTFWLR